MKQVLLVATSVAISFAAECTVLDLQPFAGQYAKCQVASGIPASPGLADLTASCAYPECQTWFTQLSTLTCTIQGQPAVLLGSFCGLVGGSTAFPVLTTQAVRTTAPDECQDSVKAAIVPLEKACKDDSGVSSFTEANLPKLCSSASCLKYIASFGSLTCKINGEVPSKYAALCTSRSTTPQPSRDPSNIVSGRECNTSDIPSTLSQQLSNCLFVAGLTSRPSNLAGMLALCKYGDCSKAFKLYGSASCNIDGIPATTIASVCDSTTAPPTTTTPKPAASPATTHSLAQWAIIFILLVLVH